MIKNYLLLLALFFFSFSNAQIINIPDVNFKAKLLEANTNKYTALDIDKKRIKIDLNNDNEIQESEALNVWYLFVDNSDILSLTGVESFRNLIELNCYNNKLETLDVSLLTNLNYLSCSRNELTNLDVSGSHSLIGLDCFNNRLTTLNLSGQNPDVFFDLHCSNNVLTDLDLLKFNKLRSLNCRYNELKSLKVTAYTTLESLDCSDIKDYTFDVTKFPNLLYLFCDSNELTTLNLTNFVRLEALSCYGNKLTSLDLSTLKSLRDLNVGPNMLTSLDVTKNIDLVSLELGNNNITEIDLSKSKKLKFISINETLIKSIDLSNSSSLEGIQISSNALLESILIKNGRIDNNNYVVDNPNLKYVCTDEDELAQVENLFRDNGNGDLQVNSYCSFVPAGESFTIQGKTISDSDNNGCDTNDIPASFLKFEISDGAKTGRLIANETGNYVIKVPAGSYTITPIFENPDYFLVSPASIQVEFPVVASPVLQDFCITPVDSYKDLEITLLSITAARPGFTADYKIVFKNKGNVTQSGNVNLLFKDSVLDLINATPVVSTQTSNNLSWNFTNLKPFESREIKLALHVNAPAVNINDILKYTATINSSETDEKPIDNTFVLNQTVVGSYDPNDKTCLEGNIITPALIGEYVHYMIRFENTGNYAAENIVVKDIIDLSKFDISTLVPTSASHSYTTNISKGNKVEFIFENINLPFDDANNDGYIAFKIKTLPNLTVGESFTNEANIYFDYNFPILTNKAISTFKTLENQDFEFSNYFNIYPNPAKNDLNISSNDSIKIESISVYDILGRLLIAVPNADNTSKIDVSKLRTGNYILKIKTEKGFTQSKFIKK